MFRKVTRDTECYCGVRYFQLPQFIEPYRVRSAIPPPNEKASCAEYSDPGFCCITSAELPPKSSGNPFGLAAVMNIKQFGGLSMSLTPSAYNRDTENYIVKNTHVCCAVHAKSTVLSETVHVMPSGNCEVKITLLLERQMKNIWTGVCSLMEHRQTTTDLSAISTEALSQYQIVFFWHTECSYTFALILRAVT